MDRDSKHDCSEYCRSKLLYIVTDVLGEITQSTGNLMRTVCVLSQSAKMKRKFLARTSTWYSFLLI